MENKRKYRDLEDTTKQKISQQLRNRGKSESHKQAISNAMKEYWKGVPNKPQNDSDNKEEN